MIYQRFQIQKQKRNELKQEMEKDLYEEDLREHQPWQHW